MNFAILKSPLNWAMILIVGAMVLMLFHFIAPANDKE